MEWAANIQGAVHTEGCGCIGCRKFPARENREHDLEPGRDPVDAGRELDLTHAGLWTARQVKHKFRFDSRLRNWAKGK